MTNQDCFKNDKENIESVIAEIVSKVTVSFGIVGSTLRLEEYQMQGVVTERKTKRRSQQV